jgi:ABC-2 type transport system permease protein
MLKSLTRSAKIYAKLQILHIRVHLEYEADFWIGIVGSFLRHIGGFVFVWTLFSRIRSVEGWTLWEMAFLYALATIPLGLVEVFYDGQWEIWRLINRGEFDRLLIRPLSPALQVITQISSIHGLGSVILGSGIVIQALITLHPAWSLAKSLYLIATLSGSFLIVGGLNYISNCFFFFDQGSRMSLPLMVQNSVDFARYPLTLYARAAQVFITWVLPFAFVAYYPTLLLLDKMNPPPLLSYLSPLAGLAVTALAALVWRRCLISYQGTGS